MTQKEFYNAFDAYSFVTNHLFSYKRHFHNLKADVKQGLNEEFAEIIVKWHDLTLKITKLNSRTDLTDNEQAQAEKLLTYITNFTVTNVAHDTQQSFVDACNKAQKLVRYSHALDNLNIAIKNRRNKSL